MKSPRQSSVQLRERCAAFTLIELLTVMAIILILAGLIIGIAGSAQNSGAKARAQAEIKQMETALESYKVDNGSYPSGPPVNNGSSTSTPTATDSLDARQARKNTDLATYQSSSQYLYQALSGFIDSTGAVPQGTTKFNSKTYITFQANQLAALAGAQSNKPNPNDPNMYIVDPFGNSYGYSTIQAYHIATNDPNPSQYGYNPTFDLWSTNGYGAGRTYPSNLQGADEATQCASVWTKNW